VDYDPNPSELAQASSVGNVADDSSDEDIEVLRMMSLI